MNIFCAFLLSAGIANAHDNRLKFPPTNHFEEHLRNADPEAESQILDVRVVKALGSKGYDKVRLSVINHSPTAPASPDVTFTYSDAFQYRWKASFDMGVTSSSCSSSPALLTSADSDGDCLLACSADDACTHYVYDSAGADMKCSTYSDCDYAASSSTSSTYQKYGTNYLHSAIVTATPGTATPFTIDNTTVSVLLPLEDGPSSGIVWSDPCISGRWVGCSMSSFAFNHSVDMLNVLSTDPTWHYFQILGDNFYDQDGRLTKHFFNSLSLSSRSKILMTVPGNHDLWVCGGPDCGDKFDQYGHGLMQWYAQDTVASSYAENAFLDFTVDPDAKDEGWDTFEEKNKAENFVWYNKMGSVGFVGFNGAGLPNDEEKYFEEACAYMKGNVDYIFALGHWNDGGSSVSPQLSTPDLRTKLAGIDGCDIGDNIKYMDGHTHCNELQTAGEKEEVGFMIGGHGMSGCTQFGFAYVKSAGKGEKVEVYYFEEWDGSTDKYEDIKACIEQNGVDGCLQFATKWL
mmetsp:Transcript_23459/g.48741  ORF Transcript_23459/g.48741 Transcript_23459/m.48741 type:complete len:516 (-) Transcript_23459:47-1594(-)